MNLERKDAVRLSMMRAELSTVRLDGAGGVDVVLPELRDLLDTDVVLLYSVAAHLEEWRITRWHQAGGDPRCGELLGEALGKKAASSIFYYDVLWPAAAQRNRVVDASRWIDRSSPGTWEASRMYREVLEPVRMHRHSQPRALICDGPSLLAWFGALHPSTESRRQMRLLSALVPAVRQRLTLERQLDDAPRTANALRAAIEHLGSAAFIIGAHGAIHETNAAGRTLLTEDRTEIAQALQNAVARRPNAREIELVPLVDRGVPTHFLAIVRGDPVAERIASCVKLCVTRWSLTARQAEVLALVARGLANATIAATLRVGERSIELHMTAIFDRAGLDSRAALVARVLTSD
ncbi:MAG: hypothetical protein H0T42_31260 [Deltaproteobacteria bacterium]|nr:hypothetical protein [Deltaproteobacteria bacterium]